MWDVPTPALFIPHSPAEGTLQSRDEILSGFARNLANPWDGRLLRAGHFIQLLKKTTEELNQLSKDFPAVARNTVRIRASVKMLEINVSDLVELDP